MMYRLILLIAILAPSILFAQNCPENIGFESGSFQHWKLYMGSTETYNDKNSVSLVETEVPVETSQRIMTDRKEMDPYGNFPVMPKNGGNFSVKLGNDGTGAEAEGISYLIDVPVNKTEFTLTYQYAVVLQDPNHLPEEQPRFIARVKDLSTGEYIPCASFEYIATAGLPGFKKSNVSEKVIYKDWSAVTINLSGYEGKKLLLEFITTDCTLNGHFGYAYVDVNSNCANLIVGNKFCNGSSEMNISGPSGFKTYGWYNADRTVKYGSGQSITIKPIPVNGSKILLDIEPFDGYGCATTISTVATSIDYQVQTKQKDTVCAGSVIDLLSDKYILNKIADFDYLAFEDKDLTIPVTNPVINKQNTYYIKATNYKGCETVSTIEIVINDLENVKIVKPKSFCYDEIVDLTANEHYAGKLSGITKTYFSDADAKTVLIDPTKITKSGTYYIKLTSNAGCTKVLPIDISFNAKPKLMVTNPAGVCYPNTVNIADHKNFAGSDADLTYNFYNDKDYKSPASNPEAIAKTGTYYISAVNTNGCTVYGEILVVINSLPMLEVKNPAAVCYPQTVDITNKELYANTNQGCTFSFFTDENLTKKLNRPSSVAKSGTYYVQMTNASGCAAINKIDVTINNQPTIVINKTQTIFDNEYMDLTASSIISGSKDYVSVGYYFDRDLSRKIENPAKINKAGVYYISITNSNGCSATAPVEVNVLPKPNIMVPTAFTPQQQKNNRLYPFLVSMQKLISFKVFNKWGILVYESNTQDNMGWNGQFKNSIQPFETFSWFAEGLDLKGSICSAKGKTIMIL